MRLCKGRVSLTRTHFATVESSESGFTGLADFQDCCRSRHSQLNPANPKIRQILILTIFLKVGTREAGVISRGNFTGMDPPEADRQDGRDAGDFDLGWGSSSARGGRIFGIWGFSGLGDGMGYNRGRFGCGVRSRPETEECSMSAVRRKDDGADCSSASGRWRR